MKLPTETPMAKEDFMVDVAAAVLLNLARGSCSLLVGLLLGREKE